MSKTLTVNAAALAAEATWIAKAAPKSGLPICAAVQVGVDDGALSLRRTNYDLFAHTGLDGAGGAAAALLVDAAQLAAALKGAVGDAKIDVADDRLRLAIGGRILSLTAMATTTEFPAWPEFAATSGPVAILRAPQLARALTSVSDDDTLPALGVVRFENGVMVSTDRFRLTRIRYDDTGFTAHIPAGVLRPFASGDGLVRVEHGTGDDTGDAKPPRMVRLSDWGYGRIITAPVADTDFPKWQQLIPGDDTVTVSILIRRRDLLNAVDGDNVTLTIGPASILVASSGNRDGDLQVEQSIEVLRVARGDGLPLTVRLNTTRLRECLKGISSGAVQLMASTPDKPVLLCFSDDLHLLMPIRIPA
jgi:DNA polymerase III sliding clamp (beta) subunit (PCNA family)